MCELVDPTGIRQAGMSSSNEGCESKQTSTWVRACSIILDFVAELFGSRFNPFECGLRTMRRI